MDFKDYIKDRLDEADDSELAFSNAGDVLSDMGDIINNIAAIFSAMSSEGSLNGNKVVPVQCVEIRKKINDVNVASKNKDEVFTDEECRKLKTISTDLKIVVLKKIKEASDIVNKRTKAEQEKAAKQAEKETPPVEDEPEPEI